MPLTCGVLFSLCLPSSARQPWGIFFLKNLISGIFTRGDALLSYGFKEMYCDAKLGLEADGKLENPPLLRDGRIDLTAAELDELLPPSPRLMVFRVGVRKGSRHRRLQDNNPSATQLAAKAFWLVCCCAGFVDTSGDPPATDSSVTLLSAPCFVAVCMAGTEPPDGGSEGTQRSA